MTNTELTAYNYVRRGIARTRAELSKTMGISRPTASAVADSLIAWGLLRDGGKWRSSGGRNPILLLVCPEAFSLIGVDLGLRDRVAGVLVNAKGEVVRRCEMMMAPDSPDRAAEAVSTLWERLDPDFSANGIGLAVPGEVDRTGCHVEASAYPCFGGGILVRTLRKRFIGKYFYLGSRDRMAAVSERFGGAADREENFMLLTLNGDLEATLFINGGIFSGVHGAAGKVGKLPVPHWNGSGETSFGEALSPRMLKECPPTPEQLATFCAQGIGKVLDILDIGLVVLGGRFLDFSADFLPLLERRLGGFGCRVGAAAFRGFSAARGAALSTHLWP